MQERRFDTRKLINTRVRLYHPDIGRLEGIIDDISGGGLAINLTSVHDINVDATESPLLLRPINLDVLFPVSRLRQTGSKLVVKFLE